MWATNKIITICKPIKIVYTVIYYHFPCRVPVNTIIYYPYY
jgi:hypothetical protein